jgi:glycosyltransferase involved in cell wall biosynthesis
VSGAVAVLIPALDEERTISQVVHDFRRQLPGAVIHVFDNGSRDGTRRAAEAAGALVCDEPRRGKGFVVQSMFARVDADIYLLVDGDCTYDARDVHALLAPLDDGRADMVVGSRLAGRAASAIQPSHRLANYFFRAALNSVFGSSLTDVLSGYRALTRPLVRALALQSGGFDVEVELTLQTLERDFRILEVPTTLAPRPPGSHSKIRPLRDGWSILGTIAEFARRQRPTSPLGLLGAARGLRDLLSRH